jgi:hypothetical protein
MTLPALRDDALVSTPTGFALRLSLPWIRSLPLAGLLNLDVVLEDESFAGELRVRVGERLLRPADLLAESGWWFLQDRLELHVPRRLAAGEHEVTVSFTLLVPYLQAGPDGPLMLPFRFARALLLDAEPAHPSSGHSVGTAPVTEARPAAMPPGWRLGASSFNWTPDVIRADRSAHDIVVAVVADGVADLVELEAGQVWRSFPTPAAPEVDRLRADLDAAGGAIGAVGLSIDDWLAPGRRRSEAERFAFLRPQLDAAHRVGAQAVRLPIGQAGPEVRERMLPLLHELDLTLLEEVQGQQTPQSAADAAACESIIELDDPHVRFVVDISILMPSLPPSYLERLAAGGVPDDLVRRLTDEWRAPETHDAVLALLRSGGVPPAVHTLYMNLLIRFGRSELADLEPILPFTSAVHLKFWDLDDEGGRVSGPIRDLAAGLARTGFTGSLTSEWGGHEWLDDDPSDMTGSHLALARAAVASATAGTAMPPAPAPRSVA